jgi:hypothetical protein
LQCGNACFSPNSVIAGSNLLCCTTQLLLNDVVGWLSSAGDDP